MFPDTAADFDVLVANRGGFFPGECCAFFARTVAQKITHAGQRPMEIDGGGPRREQQIMRTIEGLVGGIRTHGQRHAVSRRCPDQRRTTHDHRLDGVGRVVDRLQRARLEPMRQLRLVDDLDIPASAGIARPDGAVGFAVDLHDDLDAKGRAY
jgi:hypothetical protein